MRKARLLRWVGLAGATALVGYWSMSGDLRCAWCWATRTPLIQCPSVVDLGDQEFGEVAHARFTIANTGSGDLVIDDIHHSCSCTGIEQERDGALYSVESVRIPPGTKADLLMRLTVRGVPVGERLAEPIDFRTNDLICPSGRIVAFVGRVTGGVMTWPRGFFFGVVPAGADVRETFDIDDYAVKPRNLESVTASRGAPVRVRVIRPDGPTGPDARQKSPRIGRLELTVDTSRPGIVDALISLKVPGGKATTIPVIGRVAAPVEFSPGAILLPRVSSSGPVCSVELVCQSIVRAPLGLEVESVPPGVKIECVPGAESWMRVVRLSIDSKAQTSGESFQSQVVRFRANAGDHRSVVELPILRQM